MFFLVLEYKQNELWFYVFFGIRNINKMNFGFMFFFVLEFKQNEFWFYVFFCIRIQTK
jgi:hypothetical protein